jgi:hypothetical protein
MCDPLLEWSDRERSTVYSDESKLCFQDRSFLTENGQNILKTYCLCYRCSEGRLLICPFLEALPRLMRDQSLALNPNG